MAKIHWESTPTVSQDGRDANALVIETFGLPKHRGAGCLAVVGGGPSIRDHIEELKAWEGDIWAVNGAINWCLDHGINAAFYTADAAPKDIWPYDLSRVKRAVLAPDVAPSVISYLLSNGAEVSLTGQIQSGPTSANATDYLSLACGYAGVDYFGCEGCFAEAAKGADTHAVNSVPIPDWIIVEVGGEYFKTKHEFVSQSIMLANVIREFPMIYSEKSGGLLRAMIEHGFEYDVPMVATTLFNKLKDHHEKSPHDATMLALIEHDMLAEVAA